MQANEEENPGEKLGAVTPARQLRPPQNPTRKQADDRLKNRGFPMERNNLLGATKPDGMNGCKDQADHRNHRRDLPLPTRRIVQHGYKEEHQGRGMCQTDGQIQPRNGMNQQRQFAERRKGKAAPSGKPKTEITSLMIAAAKEKQDQQDDRWSGFKENDSEQALLCQQHAAAPGRTCRRCCASSRRAARCRLREAPSNDPSKQLTRYFLTRQGRTHLSG